ncbi:Thyroid adenoma-associated protein-like [Vitis vinifera]|uniref:Thyroid adenoma-associated protein-like n=2 Tax=Vitis vinifera TaxID=29760 RepID=A0A438HDT6_VITVI|nr:Thyroid adenoma-associated protein-like [Vitis vinifera]
MSAKWRALQHRHRYTYSAVVFPQSYVESLNSSTSGVVPELNQLISLNSIYAQVDHAKQVASAFTDLLLNCRDEALISEAARLYLEILFLENSLPLHRTLISGGEKVLRLACGVVDDEFAEVGIFGGDCGGVRGFGGFGYCVWSERRRFGDERVVSAFAHCYGAVPGGFVLDCFVAAGVAFCAALQACLSPEEVPYKGDVYTEICNFAVLSRLCLIRGILTAVSRTVLTSQFVVSRNDLNGFDPQGFSNSSVQTILYDGILPELCNYCENPTDSHFNFHALTVMQICLQQIKTSMSANLASVSENYDLIPEDMGTRILRIIWNNLEDPLSQTVKQVHLIFDLFLDIQSSLHWAEDNERIKPFLCRIATDLLRMGPRCKGRYVPLASLTKRLGAKTLLGMSPDLLFETVHAYIDDDVCCAATSFLKCFFEHLRDECWSSDGIEGGYAIYRGHCLSPLLCGLASGVSKLRTNLNTYALPVLLEIDVDSIFPMLAFVSVGQSEEEARMVYPELSSTNMALGVEQQVAVLVSLLKVSRSLALIEGDIDWWNNYSICEEDDGMETESIDLYALVCIKGMKVKVQVEWLTLALTHVDESLRIDAAESLFLNPKTSSLPSHLELSLLKEAAPLNMRSCSTAFQMKWASLFRKFFARVRTALERQFKQGSWQPISHCNKNGVFPYKGTEEAVVSRAEDLFHFMKWLSSFLFFSCYPSAPYERKIMAMELILIMLNVWTVIPPSQGKRGAISPESCVYPYNKGFTLPDSTLLLVGSIIDSWDRLRENSFRILLHFPTPLPGISSEEMVKEVIIWAKKLICSPRVRESDAGALALRLIFRKYVLELGWNVQASVNVVSFYSESELINGNHQIYEYRFPVIEYIKSLIDWLHVAVEEGEKDLSEACRNSFVHGILLTLRYTFEELDWNSNVVLFSISEMRHVLEKLLELVVRITSLALWVVSADAWYLPEDMDDMVDDDTFLVEVPTDMDVPASSSEHDAKTSKLVQDIRPPEQIVMVGCWLAMKEVSLLLGTIIRKIPLPSNIPSDKSKAGDHFADASDVPSMTTSDVMLDLKQLETIGKHFLEVLLKMKHNGAIDKTRAGFTALCNRLLCSNDPRLTENWMEQLMEKTTAKGQIVDDLLRRSAGIPAAFMALFLSEPEGTPKKLLPHSLRWLIDVASQSLLDPTEANSTTSDLCKSLSTKSTQATAAALQLEMDVSQKASKTRDEGVIPTVHAFNVLRAAFNDTNLATDTSGFSAEALIISIRSFSSPYWEVRNSACLAYTALVRRMIGFLNVQKRESARRALTGLEFFHRYPSLHPFLFNELKVVTDLLTDVSSEHSESNLAKVVHPSLCPMLILLSRLKPSTITSETGDALDPFLFMPFIRRCSTQSNLRVRVLASRALTGLVSNEKLPVVLLAIASELPCTKEQMKDTRSSSFNTSNGTHLSSFNSIHGMLLQLSSLLDTNCRNLADFSKKDQILGDLIQILVMCSWIGSPRLCPCPILNGSFLRVLDQMLSIARICQMGKNFGIICNFLWELSSECLDIESSHKPSYYDPTAVELYKQAAVSYFGCVFQASKEEGEEVFQISHRFSPPTSNLVQTPKMDSTFAKLPERLVLSMSSPSYEVRHATMKWLLQFLKSTVLDKLVSLYELARHTKTREALICCMGICVKRFAGLFTSYVLSEVEKKNAIDCKTDELEKWTHLYECINYFVSLIKQLSAASEPVNMRKAAAESMVVSGLLEQAELIGSSVVCNYMPSESPRSCFEPNEAINMFADEILDIWFTCIRLLEDEDVGLRQRLAMDVQKCFASNRFGKGFLACAVPSQVEKVIESCFEFLSLVFGHWIGYFDYLMRWVYSAGTCVVSGGDLVRHVFDKEIDNHHEEKLLICQICCSHLEKLLVSKPLVNLYDKAWLNEFLQHWRMRFCQQLVSFANDHVRKQRGVSWVGGVGNHKDAFLPLYANMLGFHALSNCVFIRGGITDGGSLLSDVVKVGETIDPFLRNPLIQNLYLLVVKSHERMVSASTDHLIPKSSGDDSIWEDGADPFIPNLAPIF